MNLSLPASLSETEREEKRKIKLFAPLWASDRGWGRGQIRLVELTLEEIGKRDCVMSGSAKHLEYL